MKNSTVGIFVLFASAGLAAAQAVTPTGLTGGTQGPFDAWEDDTTDASLGSWFTFSLGATTNIDIDMNRTVADSDLFAFLFSGDVTGLDMTALALAATGDQTINAFTSVAGTAIGDSFGALTLLATEDDTHDDLLGGPFGDPQFVMSLDAGTYSMIVAQVNDNGMVGAFNITSNLVPAPSSMALLGLGGLAAIRRRR